MSSILKPLSVFILAGNFLVSPISAQEADLGVQEGALTLDGFAKSAFFELAPRGEKPPSGYGLLVVLPGGPGTADFLPFVTNGVFGSVPEGFVGAMLTAPTWRSGQKIVWPTRSSKVRGMEYTTEEAIDAVVAAMGARHELDSDRLFLLGWSSSGPAVYRAMLRSDQPFAGAYVAMSVFKERSKRDLVHADGARFLLDQSPDDTVTPFRFAEKARDVLSKHGAEAHLVTYEGGHGWKDDPLDRLRDGLRWLTSDEAAPEPDQGAAHPDVVPNGKDLVTNGTFSKGTKGWMVLNNSGNLTADTPKERGDARGNVLHLAKSKAGGMDLVRQNVPLPAGETVIVSAQLRAKGARNAWLKFFVYDENDSLVVDSTNIVHITGDREWGEVSKAFALPATADYGVVMLVCVLDGEVWLDDVKVQPAAK